MEETATTTPNLPVLVPRPGGRGALLSGGIPGNKGGRPPNEFKELCRRLTTRKATVEAVKAILEDKTHPHFIGALKWATEHGYGKPKETVEVNATIQHGLLVVPSEIAPE